MVAGSYITFRRCMAARLLASLNSGSREKKKKVGVFKFFITFLSGGLLYGEMLITEESTMCG